MGIFSRGLKFARARVNRALPRNVHQRARHDYKNVFLKSKNQVEQFLPLPLCNASVLILGCGYAYQDVILFSNVSKRVTGLDVARAFYRDGPIALCKDFRRQGTHWLTALVEGPLVHYWECPWYYRYLTAMAGVPIEHSKYELVSYDGRRMPFENDTYDAVLSNAVLEHMEDMGALVQELCRITKVGGLNYHCWHNYYSLSGGHVSEQVYRKDPWGHLRREHETFRLNRLTRREIEGIFSRHFRIVASYDRDKAYRQRGCDEDFEFEGEDLLTDNIRAELRAYPRDELLTRGHLLVTRKER